MFIKLYKSSSVPLAFFLASFLLFFGVANGLAKPVYALKLVHAVLVGDHYPAMRNDNPCVYYYFVGNPPSYYEAFPFLQDLRRVTSNNGTDYVPYGTFPQTPNGTVLYPFFYRQKTMILAGSVPDDWTQDDIDNLNSLYNDFTQSEKDAITGTFIAGNTSNGESTGKFLQFNTATVGTPTGTGGVYAYDSSGNVVASYPSGNGYAVGYRPNPDGSYSEIFYHIDGDNVTETPTIPTIDYSTLNYDSESGHYSLNVPDYSSKLDTIISRIDNIDFPAPAINVNPEVTVTVPPPDITVNVPDTDLSDVESSLFEIGNTLVAEDHTLNLQTNDLQLSSDEQLDLNTLRSWQVDIPLLGDAVDFGLNSLIGKIPNVGTEYVWLDYTIGGSKRLSKSSSSNPLNGYHIRIDLTSYQQTLLAVRGWLILLEALFFSLLVYKNVREALKV